MQSSIAPHLTSEGRASYAAFKLKQTAVKHAPHPAASDLLAFTKYTFPDFDINWHHRSICEHLDAFARLEIPRLMIFCPPRHSKSELVSRRLPAYLLGHYPDAPIIATSYGASLARRMNRDVQRIIDGKLYGDVFPGTSLFGKNIRTVAAGTYLRNSDIFEVVGHTGSYTSAGIGGAISGMGMLYGIIDDPIKNRKEANSIVYRDSIYEWYTSTFRTRLAPGGAILLTLTRYHEDDLAGRLLDLAASDPKADQWEVISLPAVAENEPTDIDQRRPGEVLWPDRYDERALEATRISGGAYEWAALYQQRPAPREGGMFKYEWFDIVPGVPADKPARRVRYWDKAGTSDAGAYTAGVLMAECGAYYVEDVVMGQWASDERERIIKQTAEIDGIDVDIVVEQEPGSGGKESAENTIKMLAGFRAYADRPTGDKALRAEPLAAQAAVRNVKLVKGLWNRRYLDILASFPYGVKDPVDASSGAFNKLSSIGLLGGISV